MKPIFFTSDWHIGHENVLKFDERPFKDLSHMHEMLIQNFNACVPNDGVTYFLGDMAFKGTSEQAKGVIGRLNGTKVLILGNHDRGMEACYNQGWDVVIRAAELIIATKRVTLAHYPMSGVFRENTALMDRRDPGENWHGEKRHGFIKDEGQFHLHGHIHSRQGRPQSVKILDRQYDVGVPGNGYKPVSISTIESWIAKYGPKEIK